VLDGGVRESPHPGFVLAAAPGLAVPLSDLLDSLGAQKVP
jgi:hypothetical protein